MPSSLGSSPQVVRMCLCTDSHLVLRLGGQQNEPTRDENRPDGAPKSGPCVLAGYPSDVAAA